MAERSCFLHVGIVKAGSSALQYALAHSRKYLLDRGYGYAGRRKHIERQASGYPTGGNAVQILRALRSNDVQGAADVAARFATADQHLVLSNEGLFKCAGRQLDEFSTALCHMGFVPKCLVIFRPQTEALVSSYLQLTKSNHQKAFSSLEQYVLQEDLNKSWNWFTVAQRLEQTFGSENLTVRWWPEVQQTGGVANAAFEWLGLPTPPLDIPIVNPSPSREAAAVLHVLNGNGLGGRKIADELLMMAQKRDLAGTKAGLGTSLAKDIFNATRDSNEQLLRRYCPQLSPDEELQTPAPYFEQAMDQNTVRALSDLATTLLVEKGVDETRIKHLLRPLRGGEA